MRPYTVIRKTLSLVLVAFALNAQTALAQTSPAIAVTDLSYEQKVRESIHRFELREKYSHSSSSRDNYRDSDQSSSGGSAERLRQSADRSVVMSSDTELKIDRGELRKFTADVKGELLKSGYRLIQGKPWTQENTETLYDIIERIKNGYYPGADYVLFGSINNVEFRRDDSPIQGSNAVSHTLSLELVAEFSLINTKTYEVKAAFSAMGEGSDMKMTNSPGTRLTLNRSKVMQEVSRSLGQAVSEEMNVQFQPALSRRTQRLEPKSEATVEEKTIIFEKRRSSGTLN